MVQVTLVECDTHVGPDVFADPYPAVETDRVDHQRVPLPLPNRIPKIGGEEVLGMVPFEPDRSPFELFLKHLINPIRQDNKLKWIIVSAIKLHRYTQWLAVLPRVMSVRNVRRHSIGVCNSCPV